MYSEAGDIPSSVKIRQIHAAEVCMPVNAACFIEGSVRTDVSAMEDATVCKTVFWCMWQAALRLQASNAAAWEALADSYRALGRYTGSLKVSIIASQNAN